MIKQEYLYAIATLFVTAEYCLPSGADTSSDISRAKPQLCPFALGDVILGCDSEGRRTQFMMNRDKFISGLAASDPDRYLYMYRNAFGQPQPEGVKPLGIWESQECKLRGHASGHYLSALAQAYRGSRYDKELQALFLNKLTYLVDTLYDLSRKSGHPVENGGPCCPDPAAVPPFDGNRYNSDLRAGKIRNDYWNWGRGFISAYPPDQFIMLEKGAKYGSADDQVWAPYYTLHKILAGLLDCYELAAQEKALPVARDMALWVHARLKVIPAATRIKMWNSYIAGEYGGMNELMARLYRITGDERFIECATLFDNTEFFFGDDTHTHALAANVDTLGGKHANQHIPQIIGALETYRCTSDDKYYRVATNFWNICTASYMYSIGGVAGASTPDNPECFTAKPDSLFSMGFHKKGQNETCATYNLLKLSRQLFMFKQDCRYMDYYEQALYNHILASVDKDDPGNTYHVPLNPGSRKSFGNPQMDGFTCCNGTALESNTKFQDTIYLRSSENQSLFINLYIPSTLNWTERGITIKQETDYPYSENIRITLSGQGRFDINLRIPRWAERGFSVSINGKEQKLAAEPGSYLTLSRQWNDADMIELTIPFCFHLSPLADKPDIASIFYGPVLLAAEESGPRDSWRAVRLGENREDLKRSFSGDPATLRFSLGDTKLIPFFATYGHHSVYLKISPE